MTDQQAARIIELLESIDQRLQSVIDGRQDSVNVIVQGGEVRVTGEVTAYDPR